MAIKPSNSASISVPFTEQADAINKIIQQFKDFRPLFALRLKTFLPFLP